MARDNAARQRLEARLAEAERRSQPGVPAWAEYRVDGQVYLLPNEAAAAAVIESSSMVERVPAAQAEPEPEPELEAGL